MPQSRSNLEVLYLVLRGEYPRLLQVSYYSTQLGGNMIIPCKDELESF